MADIMIPTETWSYRATQCIGDAWAEQAFCRPKDRAEGLKRLIERRPDFANCAGAVARIIADVAPRLATPGQLTGAEYQALVLGPMHRQVSFLTATVRSSLASKLVAAFDLEARWGAPLGTERMAAWPACEEHINVA